MDDSACGGDSSCHVASGVCQPLGCVSAGCGPGERCDFDTRTCVPTLPGPHRRYRPETVAGHAVNSAFATRDAVGRGAFGEFELLVASRNGRYLYIVDSAVVLRAETTTGWVETLSGIGWPGEVDGPAGVAQFETNFYQNGGVGLTPDQTSFIFTSPFAIRKVDVQTGDAITIPNPGPQVPRALAVGRATGNLYVTDFGPTRMDVIHPDGQVETRPLQSAGGTIGYIVVDETRGVAYGLDRNRQSGAFYRWSLAGGAVEWLNHDATGGRDPDQYLSDGPVAGLEMANPGGMAIDGDGFVYIGAGDGNTFRRFDPDVEIVESLCRVPADAGEELLEWCIGDGTRNRLFGTWPQMLAFDDSGNGYFGYTVWPRLVRLRRLQ
ncbi:MAG: hypothetical protein HY904_13105 [Deltaproteobacteria bacterium]|nr:hypothetical protein [Deltaproteobacteria bacterium]